jgi:hypothetical protein
MDTAKFYDGDGNLEIIDPIGEIKLKNSFNLYEVSGNLVSSTFDTGSVSNFFQLGWLPQDQPAESGADSVKIQIATNNDKNIWNFLGPDGTNGSYYTASDTNINSVHNGDRYLRYKVNIQTASSTYTPNIGEINFTFSSQCVPPGQVLFNGMETGDYTITATKSGYQTITETINISNPWQQTTISLMLE